MLYFMNKQPKEGEKMFTGFNMQLNAPEKESLHDYEAEGEKLFQTQQKQICKTLNEYVNPDGSLSATEIESDWFEHINVNVFLSHSHADEKAVKALAAFLRKHYGIECFIDSCVWGYAEDLLKEIDEKYCKFQKEDGSCWYDYDKRNQSTSHVHMLLNGALAKMIADTECLIFVNTPNSIAAKDSKDKAKTGSPWIYSELLMATKFPHRSWASYRKVLSHSLQLDEKALEFAQDLKVEYDAPIEKLYELSFSDLQLDKLQIKEGKDPLNTLDTLYRNKGII